MESRECGLGKGSEKVDVKAAQLAMNAAARAAEMLKDAGTVRAGLLVALDCLRGRKEALANEGMALDEYQRLAQRTANANTISGKIENGILGLCGETGEIADIWKKYLHQGHELDKAHMIEELGDVLWYCAELAAGLGVGLAEVAERNVEKLRARYPDGFDAERSRNRE